MVLYKDREGTVSPGLQLHEIIKKKTFELWFEVMITNGCHVIKLITCKLPILRQQRVHDDPYA